MLLSGAYRREISGGVPDTTNNRMELTSAIMALRALRRPSTVLLHTDSRYVHGAFEKCWLDAWQRNGWRTSSRKPVVNQDLWRELLDLTATHDVTWRWVKGHADNVEHNRCDEVAVAARQKLK